MRWVRWLFVRKGCRFCRHLVPSTELVGGVCPSCADDTRQWLASIGGTITMPQGWRWP